MILEHKDVWYILRDGQTLQSHLNRKGVVPCVTQDLRTKMFCGLQDEAEIQRTDTLITSSILSPHSSQKYLIHSIYQRSDTGMNKQYDGSNLKGYFVFPVFTGIPYDSQEYTG